MRLLTCDNNANRGLFFSLQLQNYLFSQIDHANSGEHGFEVALQQVETGKPYEFFLICWKMSAGHGFVLMQKLRAIPAYQETPILVYAPELSTKDKDLATAFSASTWAGAFNLKDLKKHIDPIVNRIQHPDADELIFAEALTNIKKKDFDGAVELLDILIQTDPTMVKLYLTKGDIYLQQAKLELALKTFRVGLKLTDAAIFADRIGGIYFHSDNMEKALPYLVKGHKKDARNVNRLSQMAQCYLMKRDFTRSQQCYKMMRHLDHTHPEIFEGLGKVAFYEGRIEQAKNYFGQVQDASQLSSYFNRLANEHVQAGSLDKGIEVYLTVLTIIPPNTKTFMLLYNLGLAYRRKLVFGKAIDYFCSAAELAPDNGKIRNSIIALYKKLKNEKIKFDEHRVKLVLQKTKKVS